MTFAVRANRGISLPTLPSPVSHIYTYNSSIANYTDTVPTGAVQLIAEAAGPGGGGSGGNASGAGGGGASGGIARSIIPITPAQWGQTFTVTPTAGGTGGHVGTGGQAGANTTIVNNTFSTVINIVGGSGYPGNGHTAGNPGVGSGGNSANMGGNPGVGGGGGNATAGGAAINGQFVSSGAGGGGGAGGSNTSGQNANPGSAAMYYT